MRKEKKHEITEGKTRTQKKRITQADELLAETRSPQKAYENPTRREKGMEQSRTSKQTFSAHQHLHPLNRNLWDSYNRKDENDNITIKLISGVKDKVVDKNYHAELQ